MGGGGRSGQEYLYLGEHGRMVVMMLLSSLRPLPGPIVGCISPGTSLNPSAAPMVSGVPEILGSRWGGVVGCGLWVGVKEEVWQPVQVPHSLSVRLFLLVWVVPRLWLSTRRNSESWLEDSIGGLIFSLLLVETNIWGGDVGVVLMGG